MILACFLPGFGVSVLGESVTLAWDSNAEPDLAGYRVHYGLASHLYTSAVDVGNATLATIDLPVPGVTHYFAVTAYDEEGFESVPSEEVEFIASSEGAVIINSDLELEGDEDLPVSAPFSIGPGASWFLTVPPRHGSLQSTAESLEYAPDRDFTGEDAFRFVVVNATANVTQVTRWKARVVVNPVADAPVALDAHLVAAEGVSLPVALAATDADGDSLTFEVLVPPAHGRLDGEPPHLTYLADPGFRGNDTFSFRALDASEASTAAQVSIEVTAPPDTPPSLRAQQSGEGGLWLTSPAIPNRRYVLLFKPALPSATWEVLDSASTGPSDETIGWTVSIDQGVIAGFYSVALLDL